MREVALACLLHQGKVLVFDAGLNAQGEQTFRFLGGGIEPGESPAAAVVRELHEELGAAIEVQGLLCVLDSHFVWRDQPAHERAHVFRCRFVDTGFDQDLQFPLLDDHTVAFWKPLHTFGPAARLVPDGLLDLLQPEGLQHQEL